MVVTSLIHLCRISIWDLMLVITDTSLDQGWESLMPRRYGGDTTWATECLILESTGDTQLEEHEIPHGHLWRISICGPDGCNITDTSLDQGWESLMPRRYGGDTTWATEYLILESTGDTQHEENKEKYPTVRWRWDTTKQKRDSIFTSRFRDMRMSNST